MSGAAFDPEGGGGRPLPYGPGVERPWRAARRRRRTIILGAAVALVVVAIAFLAYLWYVHTNTPTFGGRYLFGFGFLGFFLILIVAFWCIRIAMWSTRGGGRYAGYGGAYSGGPGGGGVTYADYGPRQGRRNWDPAILEARQRYARGEISREQFRQTVQDLRESRRTSGPPP